MDELCEKCGKQSGIVNITDGVCEECSGENPVQTADEAQGHQPQTSRENVSDNKSSLFSFEGRIPRGTFWMIILPLFIISFIINIFMAVSSERGGSGGIFILALIYYIPALWIALATYVKRWHDLGLSGWMVLTMLIPFLNLLIFLYLGLAPGNPGPNKYGGQP